MGKYSDYYKEKIKCIECGETIIRLDAKGSEEHPYCARCFEKVWRNDYHDFIKWENKEKNRQ